ncbi:riboflavin synthase [bacterium]|nr:riboflavin synthase [bacterium]
MFSGIIEAIGKVVAIETMGSNKTFTIACPLSHQLKVDQSVSHNGVCLTVEKCSEHEHVVTAVEETLVKTNLNDLKEGSIVNIERCITLNTLLDGHLVQGHVDTVGIIHEIADRNGSYVLTINYPDQFANLLIEKGSVAINGISLTVFNLGKSSFEVTIIPYTWQHTMLQTAATGMRVNLEFDVIGKYIARKLELTAQ